MSAVARSALATTSGETERGHGYATWPRRRTNSAAMAFASRATRPKRRSDVTEITIAVEAPHLFLDGVRESALGALAATCFVPCGAERVVLAGRPRAVEPIDGFLELRDGGVEQCLTKQCRVHAVNLATDRARTRTRSRTSADAGGVRREAFPLKHRKLTTYTLSDGSWEEVLRRARSSAMANNSGKSTIMLPERSGM